MSDGDTNLDIFIDGLADRFLVTTDKDRDQIKIVDMILTLKEIPEKRVEELREKWM